MFFVWVLIFIVSLFALVKGADLLIKTSERIGVSFGLSPFVIGALIVGVGTSLPELFSGIAALFQGFGAIVVANGIGSNIANILFVIGVFALMGGRLFITKNLMAMELPFFVIATIIFLGVAYDGTITFIESLVLFSSYIIYIFYAISNDGKNHSVIEEASEEVPKRARLNRKVWALFIISACAVAVGAHFLIRSMVSISAVLGVLPGIISMSAVAIGTSLPELFVSIKALRAKKTDMALGNIFGSNAFNVLVAIGLPGIFADLSVDSAALSLGLPMLAAASFIFLIFGISRNIYRWEGVMFLLFYALFIIKLVGFP